MLQLISKAEVSDRKFVDIPCIANASMGIMTKLFYMPKICQVDVFDKNKKSVPENSQSIGMNIKDLKITYQKNSFIELKINFDKEIKEISGLPQDLILYDNYIKGVIQRAGQYLINIHFKDNTDYKFILEVPNLQRVL